MVFLSKPVYVLFTLQLSFDTISKKSHIHMAEKIYQYIFEARNFLQDSFLQLHRYVRVIYPLCLFS